MRAQSNDVYATYLFIIIFFFVTLSKCAHTAPDGRDRLDRAATAPRGISRISRVRRARAAKIFRQPVRFPRARVPGTGSESRAPKIPPVRPLFTNMWSDVLAGRSHNTTQYLLVTPAAAAVLFARYVRKQRGHDYILSYSIFFFFFPPPTTISFRLFLFLLLLLTETTYTVWTWTI